MLTSRRSPAFLFCALIWSVVCAPATAQDVEAESRAELLAKMREQKAQALQPYEPKGIEKALLYIEEHRVLERFSVADGWYPIIGSLQTGAGLAGGVGYRKHLLDDQFFMNVAGAMSLKLYKAVDANAVFPSLWNNRIEAGAHLRWYDYPQEDFFGLGPESAFENRSNYRIKGPDVKGRGFFRLRPWLFVGGELGFLFPTIEQGTDTRMPSIEQVFTDAEAPGLAAQPSFFYKTTFVELNTLDQPGNPRSGALLRANYGAWNDRETNQFDFGRFDAVAAHFFPIFDKKRVFAARAVLSFVNNDPSSRVPFYVLPYIGGSNSVRSFREFRFRDENAFFMNFEYRWEAFAGLDMGLFMDKGKVAADWEDINFQDLKTAYGIGFRFNTFKSVFLRIDIATGGGEGTRMFFKFSPAF